jgi:flagellar hook-length control protein FliK
MTPAVPVLPVPLIPFRPFAIAQSLPVQGATPVQSVTFDALLTAQPAALTIAPASAAPVVPVAVVAEGPISAYDASPPLAEQIANFPETPDLELAVGPPMVKAEAEPAAQHELELPAVEVKLAEQALPCAVLQQRVSPTPEAVVVAAPVAFPAAAQVAPKNSERRLDRAKMPERLEQPVPATAQFASRLPIVQEIKVATPVVAFELAQESAAPVEIAPPVNASAPHKTFDIMAALAPQAPVDVVAQLSERVLDTARGNAWLDQLASDIIAAQDSERDLSFRLMPPQLGQLDVKIETLGEGMQLNFATQTEEAAQIVAAAQPRLVEELRGQGVRVAGSEVATGSGQHSGNGQPQRQPQTLHVEQPSPFRKPAKAAVSRDNGRFA